MTSPEDLGARLPVIAAPVRAAFAAGGPRRFFPASARQRLSAQDQVHVPAVVVVVLVDLVPASDPDARRVLGPDPSDPV